MSYVAGFCSRDIRAADLSSNRNTADVPTRGMGRTGSITAVKDCMEITVNNLHKLEIDPMDIVAIGITNQRETVVVWDRYTGQPLYNAIGNLELKYNICIFQKCL